MYDQFVKNLNYYSFLMRDESVVQNRRYQLGETLKPLTDIARFNRLVVENRQQYDQLQALIWALEERDFSQTFAWELWARGFDKANCIANNELLTEQLKLVGLLLGTQYWADDGIN